MKKLLTLALFAIAIVGLATWRLGAGPGDRAGAGEESAQIPVEPKQGSVAPSEARSANPLATAAATGSESPAQSSSDEDRFVAVPGAPLADRATGAAIAWQAPVEDPVASLPAGTPPANSEVDPATGVIVLRGLPGDDTASVATTGSVPAGVKIDPATGAPMAR